MITDALEYAAHGWKIVPLLPGRKEPDGALAKHGAHDASADADVIREWARLSPEMNIGITCENFFAVDRDDRNGGAHSLAGLEATYGPLPLSVRARTGSGGEHILFRGLPLRLRGKIAPGIDIKAGSGAYIVAAPSWHPSGSRYAWMRDPFSHDIEAAPDWLVSLATFREPPPAPTIRVDEHSDRIERARRYLEKCPIAISGNGGHTTTFVVAQKIVRGFALDAATAYALLSEWNQRCEPPWTAHDLARKITQAAACGTMVVGALLDGARR